MRTTHIVLLTVIGLVSPFAHAAAQTDSASVAQVVNHAGVELDSARHATGASQPTIQSAEVAYAVATTLLGQRDYSGALKLAQTATLLVQEAGRHGTAVEIGPQIDSVPFGVETVPAGVPPITHPSQ